MSSNLIIIPYRDREEHLSQFKTETIPLLKEGLKDFLVLVVEQDDAKPFNRGALLNIGFKELGEHSNYIITHDVDFYPSLKTIKSLYTAEVKEYSILGIYTSSWGTLAPIIKLTTTSYSSLNGFPNDFWGWGVEDKAIKNRAETLNFSITTNLLSNKDKHTDVHNDNFSLRHDNHVRETTPDYQSRSNFEFSTFSTLSIEEKFKHMKKSGLNDLSYEITYNHKENYFQHLKAKIS